MFDTLFELLFKYRPAVFEQGDFRLGLAAPMLLAVVVAVIGATSALVTYPRVRGDSRALDRIVLTSLRLAALGVVLFCLLRPVLVLQAAMPRQNFLGILIDDSRSMRIADRDGKARRSFVDESLGQPGGPLAQALSDRFLLRYFRFSSSTDRLGSVADLTYEGTDTRLGEALIRAREEMAGLPLGGLIVVTDGADTTESAIGDALLSLKADQTPVFTVGVGRDRLDRDVQVGRVAPPRSVLKGAALVIDVVLTHQGYAGETVPVNVESEGRILSTQEVTLSASGEPVTARLRFTANEAGPHVFRVRVPARAGEPIAENNVREALIEVRDRVEKILYFEGEPRFEVKFIRRAVADDKNLQVKVLLRTAEHKYYRLELDHGEELAGGFPKTREELFAYRGLVLGSIEAGAFSGDQLRMIADFVDRRGGGLLTIGGRRAFAEGGYAGTPLADALPVVLEAPADAAYLARLDVRPTRAGVGHAVTQLGATDAESEKRWRALPQVTSVNQVRRAKPGATVLLGGQDEARRDHIVLAYQRYGRGKSFAFPIQDSWLWQLHSAVPVEDLSHEQFWRQLLRWVVDAVPDRVAVTTSADRVEPNAPVTVQATVVDPSYMEVNNARVVARVSAPSGATSHVPLNWTGERDGEYRATIAPAEDGLHEIRVEAAAGEAAIGADTAHIRVAPGDSEYFDAAMRASLLRRIADETGGRFYTADQASGLAEDVQYTGRGVTVVEERDLWDMPVLFLLLVGLVVGEWSYRRTRGLA